MTRRRKKKLNDVFENIAVFVEGEKQRAEKKVKNIISQDTLSADDAKQLLGMASPSRRKKTGFYGGTVGGISRRIKPQTTPRRRRYDVGTYETPGLA